MARTRSKGHYSKADAIRHAVRLMEDSEYLSEEEIKDNKRRVAMLMRMLDKRTKEDERDELRRGYCPKCHCLRTTTGKCTNGCDDRGGAVM